MHGARTRTHSDRVMTASTGVNVVRDITLPADASGDCTPTIIDLYFPSSGSTEDVHGHRRSSAATGGLPLIVVVPGGSGPKELFSMASSSLARAGYAVVVVSQQRDISETPAGAALKHLLVCHWQSVARVLVTMSCTCLAVLYA